MKSAAFLSLILLALPFAAEADESLVARRELCRQEARVSIVPKGKIGFDEYQRIVERRNAHVDQCMTRTFGVFKQPPLPPRKDVPKVSDARQETRLDDGRKKPRGVAQGARSRGLKATSSTRRQRRR